MSRHTLFPTLLLCSLAAGSLHAQATPIPKRLSTGQKCSPEKPDTTRVERIADPEALTSALTQAAVLADGSSSDFSINFDRDGTLYRIFHSRGKLPPDAALRVADIIQAHVRPQPPSRKGPAGATLRLVAGDPVRVEIAQYRYTCGPMLANTNSVTADLRHASRFFFQDRREGIDRRRTATLRFVVTREGAVQEVKVSQGTGRFDMDQEAVRVAYNMRFHPAQVDGEPVAVLVAIPITFQP